MIFVRHEIREPVSGSLRSPQSMRLMPLYGRSVILGFLPGGQFLVGSVLMMTGGFGVIILGFLGATGAIFESAFILIVVSVRDNVGVRCECECDGVKDAV